MVQAAPNKLQARFCQELSRQLSMHRVVLLFDPAEQLRSLLDALATSQPSDEAPGGLNLGGWSLAPVCLRCATSSKPWFALIYRSPCSSTCPSARRPMAEPRCWSSSAPARSSRGSW